MIFIDLRASSFSLFPNFSLQTDAARISVFSRTSTDMNKEENRNLWKLPPDYTVHCRAFYVHTLSIDEMAVSLRTSRCEIRRHLTELKIRPGDGRYSMYDWMRVRMRIRGLVDPN